MDCLSVFNPSRHLISSFAFISIHSFFFLFSISSFSTHSFFFFSLFQIWLHERLRLLHPPVVPPSQYLPKHYCDCRPMRAKMSFEEFIEFMEHIDATDIQWVVEWWHISSMAHHSLKDNCVPLVRLCYCSYYSTCRIARQFGNLQGAPSDDGSFHTLEFTNRTLSRIHESWSRWRVTRGICLPQVLHPM